MDNKNSNNNKIKRQAVVIIHGIGEQKPMDTLRDFVVSVAPKIENSSKPKFYNKPDHLSSLFELRRITATQHAKTYKTDYFEYYWAHAMRDTKPHDVWWWFLKLMFRKPSLIPYRLKWLYKLFWILGSIFTILVFSLILKQKEAIAQFFPSTTLIIVVNIILFLINYFIVWYLGDASRYMSPSPNNVAERQSIRKNGLELIKNLHDLQEDGKNKFDRIIIVGHSLGSVIAYDLINLYWCKVNKCLKNIDVSKLDELEELSSILDSNNNSEFRAKQLELWKSQLNNKDSWRISDFITIGSPLSHAMLFLAKSPEVFDEKKSEREYPTCPPTTEMINGEYKFSYIENDLKILHHAAPFALTRWTNIYFTNDFIGGPIEDLGAGIENIKLIPKKQFWKFPYNRIPFISHTSYWSRSETESIEIICNKMELRF